MRRLPLLAFALTIAGCQAAGVPPPSLAKRSAETIDPRLPVQWSVIEVADPAVEARLAELMRQARAGDLTFNAALAVARRLTDAAGPPRSESWIAAQQAVSAAVAARATTTRAMGDIDALGAELIGRGNATGLGAFASVRSAQAEVAAIDSRQASAIDALQARLRG
ncbi:MAG: hypothetical protein M3Q52_04820 [Pseudomonadota bacterium]|nr:hypothetical protein [Pseudomonadota bacterium]